MSTPTQASAPALEPAVSVAGRVAAEALMGAGLATAGFLAGPELAGAACRKCLFAAWLQYLDEQKQEGGAA